MLTKSALIYAQIGYDDRHYDHFSSRNYSGNTGNISYAQDVTSKLNLTVNVGRTYNAYVDQAESYNIRDAKSLQALWQTTSKLTIKARLDSYRQDYRQPLPNFTVTNPRLDNGLTHTIELDWAPISTISVVASIVSDRRESTISDWNYNDSSVNLSINAKF